MTESQAEQIFDSFDKDKNGVMSIWEFEQYYKCVGDGFSNNLNKLLPINTQFKKYIGLNYYFGLFYEICKIFYRASAMIESFTKMDKDNSGKLDIHEAREGLKAIDFGSRQLTDRVNINVIFTKL